MTSGSGIVWDAGDQEMQPLYIAVGRANCKWSNLEHKFAFWLTGIAEIDPRAALAIYFAPSGFKARMDILKGALRHSSLDALDKDFLDAAIKKANEYSNYRNKIVHGVPMRVSHPDNSHEFILMEGDYVPTVENMEKHAVRIPQIERASLNFDALTRIVFLATFSRQDALTPTKELQQQVEQLPTVAWNAADDPTEKARLQQRQVDRERNRERDKK